jgi:SAM-dependent methyltransferase
MNYLFAGKEQAAKRLQKIHELFLPATKRFLQHQIPNRVDTVVDLGCGIGHTTRALSSIVEADEFVGLDNSGFFIERARELSNDFPHISYKLHDVTKIPFPTEKADIIYSRFLLTHMPTPKRCIRDWSTQLNNRGLLFIEETEDIKTEVPVFKEYIKITDALLKSNGNVLFFGKILDNWDCQGKLKKGYNGVAKVPASCKRAAEIFLLNIPSWKNTKFIKENYHEDIERIEAELKELLKATEDRKTVEWEIRQVVITNTNKSRD